MNPLALFDLFLTTEFQLGLAWGVVGLVALMAVSGSRRVAPIWGITVTAAIVVASMSIVGHRLGLILGLAVLILGGEVNRRSLPTGLGLIGLGAFVVALRSGIETAGWVQLGTMLFVVVAGWTIAKVDGQIGGSGIPALMIGGSVFGVWATVPDTELARVLVGAVAATMIAAWPLRRVRIGPGGSYALAGMLAWTLAIAGEGRAGSIIGGWATIGAFVIALGLTQFSRIHAWLLFGLHAVSVLMASRIAGLQESPYAAVAIAAPVLIATFAVGRSLAREVEEDVDPA